MKKTKIVLIAHDNRKEELIKWATGKKKILEKCELFATGTTGLRLEEECGLSVHRFKSGPYGGDLEIGAQIVNGNVDLVIFFWDPLFPHPHDVDIKALLRISILYNIPYASNRATAEHLIHSMFGTIDKR